MDVGGKEEFTNVLHDPRCIRSSPEEMPIAFLTYSRDLAIYAKLSLTDFQTEIYRQQDGQSQ
jgi:hypothetical protein